MRFRPTHGRQCRQVQRALMGTVLEEATLRLQGIEASIWTLLRFLC